MESGKWRNESFDFVIWPDATFPQHPVLIFRTVELEGG